MSDRYAKIFAAFLLVCHPHPEAENITRKKKVFLFGGMTKGSLRLGCWGAADVADGNSQPLEVGVIGVATANGQKTTLDV